MVLLVFFTLQLTDRIFARLKIAAVGEGGGGVDGAGENRTVQFLLRKKVFIGLANCPCAIASVCVCLCVMQSYLESKNATWNVVHARLAFDIQSWALAAILNFYIWKIDILHFLLGEFVWR